MPCDDRWNRSKTSPKIAYYCLVSVPLTRTDCILPVLDSLMNSSYFLLGLDDLINLLVRTPSGRLDELNLLLPSVWTIRSIRWSRVTAEYTVFYGLYRCLCGFTVFYGMDNLVNLLFLWGWEGCDFTVSMIRMIMWFHCFYAKNGWVISLFLC